MNQTPRANTKACADRNVTLRTNEVGVTLDGHHRIAGTPARVRGPGDDPAWMRSGYAEPKVASMGVSVYPERPLDL